MEKVQRKFDMVVFGATGFTGKHCVKELILMSEEIHEVRWAIAGRNEEKLRSLLDWVAAETGKDVSKVEIILADVSDESSITAMCRQAKVILNLVGPILTLVQGMIFPWMMMASEYHEAHVHNCALEIKGLQNKYHFYGEVVVKTCIENGCHHLDISGETQWLERMVLDYQEKAREAGVYIVEACGFDSIPADIGLLYTKKEFPGILSSVESYLTFKSGPAGSKVNFGTFNSGIHAIANFREVRRIKRELKYQPLPKLSPKLNYRKRIFFSSDHDSWSAPFPGPDVSIIKRSQRYLYEKQNERPIQYAAYICTGGFFSLLFLAIGGAFLGLLALCRCGRKLLMKYPEVFTLGAFSHQGPSKEQIEGTSYQFNFYGKGFSNQEAERNKKHDMRIITTCTGPEPAYVATPIVMIQAGLTILQEKDKLPKEGGVYTPGSVFYDTTLIQRCHDHGVKFSVISRAEKF